MEQRAASAQPKDQCYLYSELLRSLIEVEGREVGAGDDRAAGATLLQIDRVTAKLKAAESADSKRLKSAEELMQRTTRRLSDMLHLASGQERISMKATLDKLNHVHDDILTLVFAR
jgi:predicted nucleic acid-binding protein